jgi:hypothetical protein
MYTHEIEKKSAVDMLGGIEAEACGTNSLERGLGRKTQLGP